MRSRSLKGIAGRATVFAIVAAVVLSVAGIAQAEPMKARWRNHDHGTIKITEPTQVGGTLLDPGTYEVKVRNKGNVSTVEFARWTFNPYAEEGLPGWDREVVATVDAVPQPMQTAATETTLLLASSGGKAVGLEIRGDTVQYLL